MTGTARRHVSNKHISYTGLIKRHDATFRVNANKNGSNAKRTGIYNHMLHKGLDQLDFMITTYNKVLIVRFDLHQALYSDDNQPIANFMDKLKKNLIRHYRFKHIGYWWVRELEKAQAQHYHCVLMLNGNKVQTSHKVLNIIDKTWKNNNAGNFRPHIDAPYHTIDASNPLDNQYAINSPLEHHNTKSGVIWRLSYMAKPRSKGFRNEQTKDYSTSRLS